MARTKASTADSRSGAAPFSPLLGAGCLALLTACAGTGASSDAGAAAAPGTTVAAGATHDVARAALGRAVDWLVDHQESDGYWSSAIDAHGKPQGVHDIGVTGLALLALLEAQSDADAAQAPRRAAAIDKGLAFLARVQDPKYGCFGEVNSHQAFLYDHALATRALAHAAQDGRAAALRPSLRAAVRFIEQARNPYKAWRYAYPPNGENDVSMTGFMILALTDSKAAGIDVDPSALAGGRMFIGEMTDLSTGRTGYIQRGGYSAREPGTNEHWPENESEAMTAVALACRQVLPPQTEDENAIALGADRLAQLPPAWHPAGRVDFYYWYFGTRALNQLGAGNDVWNAALVRALAEHQDSDGSFDPSADPWGHRGGRVYATAVNALSLLRAAG